MSAQNNPQQPPTLLSLTVAPGFRWVGLRTALGTLRKVLYFLCTVLPHYTLPRVCSAVRRDTMHGTTGMLERGRERCCSEGVEGTGLLFVPRRG